MNSKAITYTVKVDQNGTKFWLNAAGQRHRDDGPAVEEVDGYKAWYINGNLHRDAGPAYESANGTKAWWINGQRHRTDGPAVEFVDGRKEWWINGENMSEQEFNARNAPCNGKMIEIDGIKYELKAI